MTAQYIPPFDLPGPAGRKYEGRRDQRIGIPALIPQLRERASRTEELRRLPPETERDLHDAGLFRILQPKRVGGSELDYVALVDCADAIGQADASVAWNFANLASHHWMLGMFDQRAQDAVWSKDADALIASSFIFPAGRARKVDGGYVLSGNWPFSSGVDSCEWNMLASVVSSDDEADGIEYRIFLLNKSDYKIIDTWNATGLRGTGSNDVEVDGRLCCRADDGRGERSRPAARRPEARSIRTRFMRCRSSRCFPMCCPAWRLGNAQACLDDYVEIARHRASTYNRAKIGDMQSTQIKIAEASAKIDAARLIMRTNCIDAMADAQARSCPRHRRQDADCGATALFPSISAPRRYRCCLQRVARGACSRPARCSASSATLTRSIRTSHSISMRRGPIMAV